jgi:hypothetical protein
MAKVQRPSQFKMITFWRRWRTFEGSLGQIGMESQTMVERLSIFFSLKRSIIDKILVVGLEGLFWARNEVGCSFGFGLWAWPLEASHYAWLKAPLTIFYCFFPAHFFGLSTKFGHSIPRPLDLDGHSVKRPLIHRVAQFYEVSHMLPWHWAWWKK